MPVTTALQGFKFRSMRYLQSEAIQLRIS